MEESVYTMNRHYKGSARLNFQHWCATVRHGFFMHPAVKLPENAVIADVGTGTGAWIFELARELPANTCFDGIDVDLSQLPHEKWLPKNVRGVKLDLYDPIPESMQHRYDYIHIRYFAICVRNSDPRPVISQLLKLAKPGGTIQWTENDLWADTVSKATPELKSSGTQQLYDAMMQVLTPKFGPSPGWAPSLPQLFTEAGLLDLVTQHHTPAPEFWPSIHDNFLMGWEEVAEFVPNGDEIRALLAEARAELVASNRGLAVVGHSLTVVGRVPVA